MIEEAPILTLRADFTRPAPDVIARLKSVPVGYLVDCMDGTGALDWRIKALPEACVPGPAPMILGPAVTCFCGPADNLAVFGAVAIAKPGDVIVAATEAHTGCALIGDLLLGMAKNAGAIGVVTDGLVRDVAGLMEVGLPVYSRGVSPNSPARSGPGTVGLPIVIGGRSVEAGDIVAADRDGVVIVPRADAARVAAKLEDVKKAEAGLLAKVRGGLSVPDHIRALLESPRTRRVG
ncbi:MAG: RraA family protein [Alphaproteobacteria bacterium]|nr:RraA family protein [Alphaproteobacteria bacterium]